MAKGEIHSPKRKHLIDLENFILTSHILANELHTQYNSKITKLKTDQKLLVKPITDNINRLKTVTETIKVMLEAVKADIE
jgi:hypothetical protein